MKMKRFLADKKIILVICLMTLAGIIIGYQVFGGRLHKNKNAGLVWMKCTNDKCNKEFQIKSKEYFEFKMQNMMGPDGFFISPIRMDPKKGYKCPACNETTAFRAIKCEKCGTMFIEGSAGVNRPFTCPECGYEPSQAE